MPKSRLHVLASFAVLAVAGSSVSSSSAYAASNVTCTASSAVSYSPGMKLTSQTITWSEDDTYSSCTSSDTSLTAGSSTIGATEPLSCNSPFVYLPTEENPQVYTISWNNSQSSTFTLTTGDNVLIDGTEEVTLVGTVTSGEFTGDDVTLVLLYVVNPLQCLTSQGVTSQSGTVTVEIVGL